MTRATLGGGDQSATPVDIEETTGITLVGDYAGLILVNSAFNLTFAVWILQGFFAAIPAETEEGGLDGRSEQVRQPQ